MRCGTWPRSLKSGPSKRPSTRTWRSPVTSVTPSRYVPSSPARRSPQCTTSKPWPGPRTRSSVAAFYTLSGRAAGRPRCACSATRTGRRPQIPTSRLRPARCSCVTICSCGTGRDKLADPAMGAEPGELSLLLDPGRDRDLTTRDGLRNFLASCAMELITDRTAASERRSFPARLRVREGLGYVVQSNRHRQPR
jgi:hypothetical protein